MERFEPLEFALFLYVITQVIVCILWLYFQGLKKDKREDKNANLQN